MRYNVDIEKFARLLQERPGLIKKIASLDEDSAAFFIEHAKKCYEYLTDEMKASVKVVRSYIKDIKDNYNSYRYTCFNLDLIPTDTLAKLTLRERKRLIAVSTYKYDFFPRLPNKVYEEWLHAVKEIGYPIEDVPEKYYTRKSLYEAYARYIGANTGVVHGAIPEKFWEIGTDQANKDLVDIIGISCHFLMVIPPKRITKEHLVAAFQSGERLSLGNEEFRQIPRISWDKGIVALALKSSPHNIEIIPPSLLTENDALHCADEGVELSQIPSQVLTRKVRVHLAACRTAPYIIDDNDTILHEVDFQCDVAEKGGRMGAKNIAEFVKPENRLAVLKRCPDFIRYIPKREQIEKTIDVLLESASPEKLDEVCEFINLGKIKKHHAPLLVGCASNIILSTVEKKLKGAQRKMSDTEAKQMKTKKTSFTVEINAAPVDFAKIRGQLDEIKFNFIV